MRVLFDIEEEEEKLLIYLSNTANVLISQRHQDIDIDVKIEGEWRGEWRREVS